MSSTAIKGQYILLSCNECCGFVLWRQEVIKCINQKIIIYTQKLIVSVVAHCHEIINLLQEYYPNYGIVNNYEHCTKMIKLE